MKATPTMAPTARKRSTDNQRRSAVGGGMGFGVWFVRACALRIAARAQRDERCVHSGLNALGLKTVPIAAEDTIATICNGRTHPPRAALFPSARACVPRHAPPRAYAPMRSARVCSGTTARRPIAPQAARTHGMRTGVAAVPLSDTAGMTRTAAPQPPRTRGAVGQRYSRVLTLVLTVLASTHSRAYATREYSLSCSKCSRVPTHVLTVLASTHSRAYGTRSVRERESGGCGGDWEEDAHRRYRCEPLVEHSVGTPSARLHRARHRATPCCTVWCA